MYQLLDLMNDENEPKFYCKRLGKMDTNLLKLLGDVGTIGILFYVLVNVLGAYKIAFERVADLLENMIDDTKPDAK